MSTNPEDQKDPFFLGATQIYIGAVRTFDKPGIDFTDDVLRAAYLCVCDHVSDLLKRPDISLKNLDTNKIVISDFDEFFHDPSDYIMSAMTHFFRCLLRNLQANPELVKN